MTRGILLTGLRGAGKTVLLNEFSEMARRNGWLIVQFEAKAGESGPEAVRRSSPASFNWVAAGGGKRRPGLTCGSKGWEASRTSRSRWACASALLI